MYAFENPSCKRKTPELVTECQGLWMGAPVARTSSFSVDLREKRKVARRSFEK